MAGIGNDAKDPPLVAVERVGIETGIIVPECLIEMVKKHLGFPSQLMRPVGLADVIINLRHAKPSVIDIALKFAERLRSLHERTVGINDGLARILPALILVTHGRTRLVFLKSVSVAITILIDPFETLFGRGQMPVD